MSDFNLITEFEELNKLPDLSKRPELIDLCEDVEKMAEEEIGVLFNNEGQLPGAVVMSTIFLHSNASINIFTKNFNGDISNVSIWKKSLMESLKSNPNLHLNVIVEEFPYKDSVGTKTILSLKHAYPNRVAFDVLTDRESVLEKAPQVKLFSFIIGDNNKFRLETDKKTHKAVCSFDNKETANKLLDVFTMIKSYTKEVEA